MFEFSDLIQSTSLVKVKNLALFVYKAFKERNDSVNMNIFIKYLLSLIVCINSHTTFITTKSDESIYINKK